MKKTAFVTIVILLFIALFYLVGGILLVYEKPVKSPYVLLEDWIWPPVLEDASSYIIEQNIDSVFIVGVKNSNTSVSLQEINKTKKLKKNLNNIYALYDGGILGFDIPTDKLGESFTLNVKMHGTSYANLFPYYRIFFNKQFINSGFVNEQDAVYQFVVSKKTTDSLTTIFINFDNAMSDSEEDRILYISDIYIDTMDIDSIMLNHFFISYTEEPIINFVSPMNSIKYYIGDRGYDTSKVKLIEVNYDSYNKTLALAKGAKKYFRNTEIKNINIITVNKHSRRSYLNFKNCLGKNIEVGCIPFKTIIEEEKSFFESIDERVSLLFSWIYWWFH
jgi:hypothetical protein